MGFGIAFSPLVPNGILWAALAVAAIAAVLLIVIKSRGALVRAVALAFAALALANPSLTKEDRESLPSPDSIVEGGAMPPMMPRVIPTVRPRR